MSVTDSRSVKSVQSLELIAVSGGLSLADTASHSTFPNLYRSGTHGAGDRVRLGNAQLDRRWDGGTEEVVQSGGRAINVVTRRARQATSIEGTAIWPAGSLGGHDATIENAGTFTANSTAPPPPHDPSQPIFENLAGATLTKTTTGTTAFPFTMDNDGAIAPSAGTLNLSSDVRVAAQVGSFGGTGTGLVDFHSGLFKLGTGASFTGAATINGATMDVAGTVGATAASALTLASGAIGGTDSGTLKQLTWTGGSLTGSGTTTIASGGTLTVSRTSGTAVTLDAGTSADRRDGPWTSGRVDGANGGTIENAGTFTANGTEGLVVNGGA